MATWMVRLKGDFHFENGFGEFKYQAQSAREGKAGSRSTLELREANNDNPAAIFELDSVFGYRINPNATITVWRRNPAAGDECFVTNLTVNFVKPGKLGELDTWDLWERENDPNGPIGRFLAIWVSEIWRAA